MHKSGFNSEQIANITNVIEFFQIPLKQAVTHVTMYEPKRRTPIVKIVKRSLIMYLTEVT